MAEFENNLSCKGGNGKTDYEQSNGNSFGKTKHNSSELRNWLWTPRRTMPVIRLRFGEVTTAGSSGTF
jgi:hypothetical protein